jgi:acyl transferase domain-containing protein
MPESSPERTGLEVAVTGLTGRFPKSDTVESFWADLCDGVECISFFTDDELEEAGLSADVYEQSAYVPARAVLDESTYRRFDADFFGISPREAEIIDPQQRLFLECAWEALERAACVPDRVDRRIGVFASTDRSSYAWNNLASNPEAVEVMGRYQTGIGNLPDHLPTRVSYKLNLEGPSVNVQTACSSSLVAIHQACQSLLSGECDAAIAGGSSVAVPHRRGHFYQPDGILSEDGHCRPFDAAATGTTGGCGVGAVVLRRLADAEADGSPIHAVIRGTAVNNDGARKVGYTAPSVQGQAEVIEAAHTVAGVDPRTVTFVETHGTGTELGDPIEVEALTQAFRQGTDDDQFCALGAVKSNVGHLDSAAGVTGFIKTVLALKHGQIPPTLHFEEANPEIPFSDTPFFVNDELSPWSPSAPGSSTGDPDDRMLRRAGVSSFGIGGTNAHAVLEEPPERPPPTSSPRPYAVLPLSAKTSSALDASMARIAASLGDEEDPASERSDADHLADVAYTLQVGRRDFWHRATVVASSVDDARQRLEDGRVSRGRARDSEPEVVFQFSGQGSQYAGMTSDLYDHEPVFRDVVNACARQFLPHLGFDLRSVLYPDSGAKVDANERLTQTSVTQPALFTVELALARLWEDLGVTPDALIGHSIGELVAAHVAEVFSLDDACRLVAERGRLMQEMPEGSMLAVPAPEDEVRPLLDAQCSVAAVNTPSSCVVSGPDSAIDRLAETLQDHGRSTTRLRTSHAFHSPMMQAMVEPFRRSVESAQRQAPTTPLVSCVSGNWMSETEATDPAYWARHVRQAVRYADGMATLLKSDNRVLLECGPGRTLTTLAKRHPGWTGDHVAVSSTRRSPDTALNDGSSGHDSSIPEDDERFLLDTLGTLWTEGVDVPWTEAFERTCSRLVVLPTYPYERREYWIEPASAPNGSAPDTSAPNGSSAASAPAGNGISTSADANASDTDSYPESAPSPDYERPDLDTDYEPPASDVEETVATIWEEILGVAPVGRTDEFFALGGDSLIATRISSHLRETFDVDVSSDVLYEGATVASLAEHVAEKRSAAEDADSKVITPEEKGPEDRNSGEQDSGENSGRQGDRTGARLDLDPSVEPVSHDQPLPLSFSQERLWSIEQMHPGTSAYNMPFAVRLDGPLDLDVLRACFRQIIRRHAVLRTTFETIDFEPRQIIHPDPRLALTVTDLQDLDDESREKEVDRLRRRQTTRPFDLESGPLLRVAVLRRGPRDHVVLLTMHHIVTDGWSTGILMQELKALYSAYAAGEPSPLEPLSIQYADYAVWQRRHLDEATLENALDAVRRRLDGAPEVCTLPPDRSRPEQLTFRGSSVPVRIDAVTASRLSDLANQHDATLFMALLSAYSVVVGDAVATSDVVLGTDVAGRTTAATENLIGFFVNQLPLRVDLSEPGTFVDLLRAARDSTREAYAQQEVPFERIVDAVQDDRDPAYHPIFQMKILLRNQPREPLVLKDSASGREGESPKGEEAGTPDDAGTPPDEALRLDFIEREVQRSIVDVQFALHQTADGGLAGEAEYNTDLYRAATIEGLVERFQDLVAYVADRPETDVDDLLDRLAARRREAEKQRVEAQKESDLAKLHQSRRRPADSS